LALAIAPLAILAAASPRFSVAPSTGAIVALAPTVTHATAFHSAYDRALEVALGGAVALVVSHLVFPARARVLARTAAADMLEAMARALPRLFTGLIEPQDPETIRGLQRDVAAAFARLDAMEQEARRERATAAGAESDLAPLRQTLLRMRHDLVMIGRAALVPLPPVLRDRLKLSLAALATGRAPAESAELDAAFDARAREIASLRAEGLLKSLSP
jgi:uncharacterized membrane protein YccC